MKNKRGLSGVVTMVILIAVVMAGTTIVWSVTKKTVESQVDQAKSCYGIYDKVAINSEYTCYDADTDRLYLGINVGDVDIDEILVSITPTSEDSTSFVLTSELQTITNIGPYPSTSGQVKAPDKKSGNTYVISSMTSSIDNIKLAPKVGDKQCEVSDTLYSVPACSLSSVCVPSTCTSLGYNCGTWDDGCGGELDCGTCSDTCYNGVCAEWIGWLNRDGPGGTGDFETRVSFGYICDVPYDFRCETTGGVLWNESGEVIVANAIYGCSCTNSQQPDLTCLDYRVMFLCPE